MDNINYMDNINIGPAQAKWNQHFEPKEADFSHLDDPNLTNANLNETKSFFSRFIEIIFAPFKWLTDRIFQSNSAKVKPLSAFQIQKGKASEICAEYVTYKKDIENIITLLESNPNDVYLESNLKDFKILPDGLRKLLEDDLNELNRKVSTRILHGNPLKNSEAIAIFKKHKKTAKTSSTHEVAQQKLTTNVSN